MVRRCEADDCKEIAYWKNENDDYAKFCGEHKQNGMKRIDRRICEFEGCDKQPAYNFEGKKEARFCNTHKKDGMIDIKNKRCKTYLCDTLVTNKYEGYCLRCFIHTFPDKPVTRNYKTKEKDVVDRVKEKYSEFSWECDKRIQDGCSRRRPDMFLDMGSYVIIVEIDENQHEEYDCSCEKKRMQEIWGDVLCRPMIFIRFNPDDYKDEEGKNVTSCWG